MTSFLAYHYYRATEVGAPLEWLVNVIIVLVVALILWIIFKYIAAEFGVPEKIVRLIGLLIFLLLFLSLFVGCSSFDTAFRSRVSEIDPKVSITPEGSVFFGGRMIFRDPALAPVLPPK